MTGNKIGVEGAKAMSEMLKMNTALATLYLGSEKEEGRKKKEKREKRRMNDRE